MTTARAAVVTGGSSGIGRATAALLLERGWSVLICGRGEDRLRSAVASLGGGSRLVAEIADVGAPEDARRVVARAVEAFGRLDGLVNAHGIAGNVQQRIENLPEAEWDEVLRVNLMGSIWTTTAAIPYLCEARGSVVQVSSILALAAESEYAPYNVSKAALVSFARQAAHELASSGVRVNAVLPGWVETPMNQPLFDMGVSPGRISCNLMGRMAQPGEIATTIAFLLSEDASFITGESLVVDGGQMIKMGDLAPVE